MKFVDSAKIFVKAGKGGDGCMAFLHEKYREFGGPSGGNGGKGGDVIVKGNKGLYTLFDLKLNPHQKAKNGMPGSGKNRTGKGGDDLVIELPPGTEIIDDSTNNTLHIIRDENPYLLIPGGKGGLGNYAFKSGKNKAPEQFTRGEPSTEICLKLNLKLMADAGLIGFPNAGKSTFISKVSAAKPKIADYPFTTLHPNLGTVQSDYFQSFVIADIPGLIEGAAEGKGLGQRFLKHIEHTKILVFLLDGSEFSEHVPLEAYKILLRELYKYMPDVAERKKIILFSKLDLPANEPSCIHAATHFFSGASIPYFFISAVTGKGIQEAINAIAEVVFTEKRAIQSDAAYGKTCQHDEQFLVQN